MHRGLTSRRGRSYEAALGRGGCGCSAEGSGLSGMGNILDDVAEARTFVAKVTAKADKLEKAIYLIIGLSAVAAMTGVLNWRRR